MGRERIEIDLGWGGDRLGCAVILGRGQRVNLWLGRLGLIFVLALVAAPALAFGQNADPAGSGAWWSQLSQPDDATRCGALAAWNHAVDVEQQAEQDLNGEPLAAVLGGEALNQEQGLIDTQHAAEPGVVWSTTRIPRAFDGRAGEVVVFATFTRLVADTQDVSSEAHSNLAIEDSQVVYRLVHRDAAWQVSDQHVLERRRRLLEYATLQAISQEYWRLLNDLNGAFFTGDFANLDLILDGRALTDYGDRVKAAVDSNALQRITLEGRVTVLDFWADTAVLAFSGTRTAAAIDARTGGEGAAVQQPYAFVHRLQRQGNDWKIVYELAAMSLDAAPAVSSDCGEGGNS